MNPYLTRDPELAFTVVELLVVISIIALLGGLGIGALQISQRNFGLQATAADIQSVLRAARNTAITTRIPSHVVVDPATRSVTAQSFDSLGEWTFDEESDKSAPIKGVEIVEGWLGNGVRFESDGAHIDCGNRSEFNVGKNLVVEARVRHTLGDTVSPPARETRGKRRRPRRRSTTTRQADVFAIVEKVGSYSLGMTDRGALEASIGSYTARTRDGVVVPDRWIFVSLRYDVGQLIVSSDGIARELTSSASRVPTEIPATAASLTISSPSRSFRGEIDEVHLRGPVRPLSYTCSSDLLILGWKKIIRFDRRGRLDPAYHEDGVRITVLEFPEERPSKGRTKAQVDYALTYDEWVERNYPPENRGRRKSLTQGRGRIPGERELEGRVASSYLKNPGVREVVIEIDRLGVVR